MNQILYSNGKNLSAYTPNSYFLAGPTPRQMIVESWRPKAIQIFSELTDNATICVPEPQIGWFQVDYMNQVDWELSCLAHSSKILFWVPRNMETMPALTTNVEFGYWLAKTPSKVYYGRPADAVSCKYLDYLYERDTGKFPFSSLEELIEAAINE